MTDEEHAREIADRQIEPGWDSKEVVIITPSDLRAMLATSITKGRMLQKEHAAADEATAYVRGKREERAAVVEWLNEQSKGVAAVSLDIVESILRDIAHGEHVKP